MYTAKLKINNKLTTPSLEGRDLVFEGRGETIFEALTNIPADYSNVKTQGVIEVSDGERTVERFFRLKQLRILLVSHLRRGGWAFYFGKLLEGKSPSPIK